MILFVMLMTFAYSGKINKQLTRGLGGNFTRGVLFFALVYSCIALVIGIRSHLQFTAAGKASWIDAVLPKKGISLMELVGHCLFYYTSMLLIENNGFLVLLCVALNCAIQMYGRSLILYGLFVGLSVISGVRIIKKGKETFGKWIWIIVAGFGLTATTYLLKTIRQILLLY